MSNLKEFGDVYYDMRIGPKNVLLMKVEGKEGERCIKHEERIAIPFWPQLEYRKSTYLANREHIMECNSKYYHKHPEQISVVAKRHYDDYHLEHLARKKIYRCANPDLITAARKRYYAGHTAQISVLGKKYYQENRLEIMARVKRYGEKHRVQIAARSKVYHERHRLEILAAQRQKYMQKKSKVDAKCDCHIVRGNHGKFSSLMGESRGHRGIVMMNRRFSPVRRHRIVKGSGLLGTLLSLALILTMCS